MFDRLLSKCLELLSLFWNTTLLLWRLKLMMRGAQRQRQHLFFYFYVTLANLERFTLYMSKLSNVQFPNRLPRTLWHMSRPGRNQTCSLPIRARPSYLCATVTPCRNVNAKNILYQRWTNILPSMQMSKIRCTVNKWSIFEKMLYMRRTVL